MNDLGMLKKPGNLQMLYRQSRLNSNLIFIFNFKSCLMIKLLCKKLPLIWVISNSFMFIRSIISILISVMGEVSFFDQYFYSESN